MRFLTLSDDVLLFVVSSWLNSDDACRMDTAFCSHGSRKYFLTLISKEAALLNSHLQPALENNSDFLLSYWGWCHVRKVGLKSIKIRNSVISSELLMAGKELLSKVNKISLECDVAASYISNEPFYSEKNMLTNLHISGSYVKDDICKSCIPIKQFNILQSIYLRSKSVTDSFLFVLAASCSYLRTLRFQFCNLITDAGFIAILKVNQQMWEIESQVCPLVTGLTAQYAAKHCLKLQSITFDAKGDMPFWDFILSCPALRALNVYDGALESVSANTLNRILNLNAELNLTSLSVSGITSDLYGHLSSVLTKCKLLRRLGINTMTLSDSLLHTLAINCPVLLSLMFCDCDFGGSGDNFTNVFQMHFMIANVCLHRCEFINDAVMSKIVAVLPNLVDLYITGSLISDLTLEAVAKYSKALNSLLFDECFGITAQGVRHLIANNRHH